MAQPVKLTYQQQLRAKIDRLRNVLTEANTAIKAAWDECRSNPKGSRAAGILQGIDTAIDRVLVETAPRQSLSKEDRAKQNLIRRSGKRQDKMLSWLKLDGMKMGAFGIRNADQVQVVFASDPFTTPEGLRVRVKNGKDGNIVIVDAMAYRPDFANNPVIPKAAKKPRTITTPKSSRRKHGAAPTAA